jgi:ubiquitin carboxyl-terminal hydrolase 14
MQDGPLTVPFAQSLDQKVDKTSPSLGRSAVYTQTSRLSRLPAYLTVHMVRFYWRQDIQKKAKIMRKVKFPAEYDASELCTPDLKAQLLPVSRRLSVIEKDRAERRKVRKRTKTAATSVQVKTTDAASATAPSAAASSSVLAGGDVEMAEAGTEDADKGKAKEGEPLEEESVYRKREMEELEKLVSPALKSDTGCSVSGLYELVGMLASSLTHISADEAIRMLSSHRDTQRCSCGRRTLHWLRQAESVPPQCRGRRRRLVQVRR